MYGVGFSYDRPILRRTSILAGLLLTAILAVLSLAPSVGAQEAEPTESIQGTLRNRGDGTEQEPVEGVRVSVATADGEQVDEVESDAEGTFEVPVPGPGSYVVTLDEDSLPEGVELREGGAVRREVRVSPGESQRVLYPFGEDTRDRRTKLDEALVLTVEGIRFGLIIAMAAVGLSLIFGTTGLTNFAHGELVTFGALVAWYLNVQSGIQLIPAAVLAVAIGGLAGGALDRLLWRPLRGRGTGLIAMLVISIGLGLLVRYVFLYQLGGRARTFADYTVQRAVDLGPVAVAPKDLFSIAFSIVVLLGVAALLQRTRLGKAMRAVADNPDLAASSGIDVQRVIQLVWVFGAGLAALGGVLVGLTEQVRWDTGFQLLLLMFAGITLGGLGTAYGALVGSFVVGLFVQVSTLYLSPELKNVGALVILIAVLLFRPQGILGQAERVG